MLEINDTEEIPEGNFPINLKLIAKYQHMESRIMAKYNYGTHHKGSFFVGSNIYINLITWEDNIVIP